MKNGFDANAPIRKPRTAIGRVLTELTAEPEADQPESPDRADAAAGTRDADATGPGAPRSARAAGRRAGPVNRIQNVPDVAARPVAETVEPKPAPAPPGWTPELSRLASSRERIAALRERLAVAARPPVDEMEPGRAAAAVREVVGELRARLETAIQERSQSAEALEEARSALRRAEADVARERKARVAAEARAEERARIADDAVAEAEAVAAERDQVLAELTDRRRLDEEQAALLIEAEAALDQRDAEQAAATREIERVRALVAGREAELVDLEGRLEAAAVERRALEARCRELEAEVARLTEAAEALKAIHEAVARGK